MYLNRLTLVLRRLDSQPYTRRGSKIKLKALLNIMKLPLREKCPYLELFWSAFSCIQAEYGEILRIYSYSVRMRENAEQNNSEYGHLLRSVLSSNNWRFKD